MIHLVLHFIVPALVVGIFFPKYRLYAYFVMLTTMLIDLDHLLATPIYDSQRCSIGFHPLHRVWLLPVYVALCFVPKTRFVGLGLVIHMMLDSLDCQVTNGIWSN